MKGKKLIALLIVTALLLCGCEILTVDQMYKPPKRSEDFNSLQSAISNAIADMEYSAPVSGENQQIVQTADLYGDGAEEFLLFAKGGNEHPLHILIFRLENDEYVHCQTIDLPGSAFGKVEYAQMDDKPGMELIVGSQVSDKVSRSVYVFTFAGGEAQQLVMEDYQNFLTVDLDSDSRSELFVLRGGNTQSDKGIVELFSVNDGIIERSIEINMSETANNLKRIFVGQLQDGKTAVFLASAAGENKLITDVYTISDGIFTNVSLSNESGTSVKTMRNYFVYADDIDSDGVTELPNLLEMRSIDMTWHNSGQSLIRWYSMNAKGEEIDKLYTYHNFIGGWYLRIESGLIHRISVVDLGNICDFYIWDNGSPVKVLSIHALTGQSREEQSTAENRFVLYKGESTIYAASLDREAALYGFTQETVLRSFYMIRENWNTGET